MTERRDMPETALHIAATILQREFSETFGVETIERFLHSCYDQLAARAIVMTYSPCSPNALPASAQRSCPTRRQDQRLQTPVLFCDTTTPAAPRWPADSLPTWPGSGRWPGQVDPNQQRNKWTAIEAMAEVGIDITEEFPKPWTDKMFGPPMS